MGQRSRHVRGRVHVKLRRLWRDDSERRCRAIASRPKLQTRWRADNIVGGIASAPRQSAPPRHVHIHTRAGDAASATIDLGTAPTTPLHTHTHTHTHSHTYSPSLRECTHERAFQQRCINIVRWQSGALIDFGQLVWARTRAHAPSLLCRMALLSRRQYRRLLLSAPGYLGLLFARYTRMRQAATDFLSDMPLHRVSRRFSRPFLTQKCFFAATKRESKRADLIRAPGIVALTAATAAVTAESFDLTLMKYTRPDKVHSAREEFSRKFKETFIDRDKAELVRFLMFAKGSVDGTKRRKRGNGSGREPLANRVQNEILFY